MKTIKELFEVYKPKSPDEQKFVDKHVTIKHKDRNGNDDDVFKATNIKTGKRKEERHGYEPGEDEKVYEDAELGDEIVFELDEEVEPLEEGKVGYKHYTITSHPKMPGASEGGDIKHVFGHPKKMGKLDIEHDNTTDYATTRRVTVKNNETGDVTHHHVYQSERNNSKGKPTLSIRTVGKAGEQQEKHANVIAHYLSGKTKIKEDTDLAFFEDLLEMNLDEDTFTDASLAQLRVMKHKQEMKKIESSSKLHPLMKVRKMSDAKKKLADLEADRDHFVAKHEKAQSKKKKMAEDVELDEKHLTPAEMKKREEIATAMERENPGMDKSKKMAIATAQAKKVAEEVEELDESAKIAAHLIKRYGDNVRKSHVVSAANDFGVDASKLAKAVRTKLGKTTLAEEEQIDEISTTTKDAYAQKAGKQLTGLFKKSGSDADAARKYYNRKNTVRKIANEEVEELDELSFKKLVDYSSKSADSVSGAPVRKQDNRIKGQSLADKKIRKMDGYSSTAKVAATNEDVEEIEELSKGTLVNYIAKASKVKNNPPKANSGYKRDTSIAKAVTKLTKEDIINRAIEKYMPEDYTPPSLDEQFIAMIEHLSEAHAVTLLSLFDSLNEANKATMVETVSTEAGIMSLLDFAIQNRGE